MGDTLKNTVFRDNIRDNRLIRIPDKVRAIIDTPVFQRLRRIKQMGLASLVFPTADHSRFSHSIGVYATAQEAFRTLRDRAHDLTIEVPAIQFDEDAERAFCAAAMCHDLGHTAYSHVLEKILLPDGLARHEDCSTLLLKKNEALRTAVEDYSKDLDAVLLFVDREHRHPNIALGTLISGPFDVDRADYLLRDTQAAGVNYGWYDLSWLLHSALVGINNQHQPILMLDGPRGMDALRQFITGRHYLYRNIYMHPTIRSAQILLGNIFKRISETLENASLRDENLIGLAPKGLQGLLRFGKIAREEFERTTDIEVEFLVRLCADEAKDQILRHLAELFVSRTFPKAILDTGRLHESLENSYGIVPIKPAQLPLLEEDTRSELEVLEQCQAAVRVALSARGQNPDLADYIVYYERYYEKRPSLTDVRLKFGNDTVHFLEVQNREAGYNPHRLTESFQLYRLYVPREFHDVVIPLIPKREKRR